jgi:hypothetical protein
MCHPVWLCSRKYGTVWYHPASSKLWYLTTLSFVNFQEKLTGTSCDSLHVWSQLVRLAVCLALGAHFASTPAPASRRIRLGADLLAEIWPDLEWCAAEQRCSGARERRGGRGAAGWVDEKGREGFEPVRALFEVCPSILDKRWMKPIVSTNNFTACCSEVFTI